MADKRDYYEVLGVDKGADADTIKAYAVPSVNAMYAAGVINGMEDGRFAPEEFATRAQAAKMIYSLIRE